MVLNLTELINEVISNQRTNAEKKGLWLRFGKEPSLPEKVRFDADKLRRVLVILLDNAIQYTESGGVTLTVNKHGQEVELSQGSGNIGYLPPTVHLAFTVQDTGPGIDPNMIEQLTTSCSRQKIEGLRKSGAGMGFPIAVKLVEMMGGKLTISSTVDEGTAVVVDLVLEVADDLTQEVETLYVAAPAIVEVSQKKYRDSLEELVKERTVQLLTAKERAEAASRAKTAFLANMSHELRTPLNAIIGYAQVLRMRHKNDPSLANQLDIIQHSGNHLLTLINDILDLSVIEAGRMTLCPTPIHFDIFLENIANIIRLRAKSKQLSFHMEIPDTLPLWVEADETRLRQILLNLLGNAVKYTHVGQVMLRLKRQESPAGAPAAHPTRQAMIYFEVTDTGIGIEQEQIDRIFQPFEQIRQVGHEGAGTGLGLAISRQLVQLMGGQLHIESNPGQGSVFWFEVALPITTPSDDPLLPSEKVIIGYGGPRRRALIADDIASNRAVLVEMLSDVGFEIIEAMDGEQAVQLARETQPDLILMDKRMPRLDGFEAAQQIRQIAGLEEVAIFAITASVSEACKNKCREFGITAYLPKPVYWPRLAALLEEHAGIEWTYGQAVQEEILVAQEDLVPPTQQELKILLELAQRGSLQAIYKQASRLEEMDVGLKPFAHRLQQLAQAFEDQAVLALINQFIKE